MKTKTNTSALKKLSMPEKCASLTTVQKTLAMNHFKDAHCLTNKNIVELLAMEGFHISASSLSSYMQGNVLGTDSRNWSAVDRCPPDGDHVSHIYNEFQKLEQKYGDVYKKLLSVSMRDLIDSWYRVLNIETGSSNRKLSKILGVGHTTIFKWYRDNRHPGSIKTLLTITRTITNHLASIRA